tara:strand:+ start:803 stop:1006 length:204 start_codon:yes stop_codon:yes gene_type:complete
VRKTENEIDQQEYHTHPPCNYIIKDCRYCMTKGNIFKHGILSEKNIVIDVVYGLNKSYFYKKYKPPI